MSKDTPSRLPERLPNAESATVPQSKICNYLLSPSHPIGRFKAAFFGAFGYTVEDWQRLQTDLLQIARSGIAVAGQESPYGRKYEVRGTLAGPSGRQTKLVTVWIILDGETRPQFVTAFPGESL